MGLYLISWEVVTHLDFVYLLPGHSFMPCDQGFSTLENRFRRYESITSPQRYAELIQQLKNSRHVYLIQKDIYDFKHMSQVIVHRTAKSPEVKFSKAHTISLRSTHPWHMFLQSTAGNEQVCLSIAPNEQRPFKDLYQLITDSPHIKHKYLVGTDIKLTKTKLQHLKIMRNFMDAPGRAWADRVFRGQLTANDRPQKQVNPLGVDLTDLIDEYERPQRVQQTETLDLDDSGNEIDENYAERPQPSPQPSPVADTPPSPNGDPSLDMSFIQDILLADLDLNEPLPSFEEEPPSTTVQHIPPVRNREPEPQHTTSRGEPGHDFHTLRFLLERNDMDSDSD